MKQFIKALGSIAMLFTVCAFVSCEEVYDAISIDGQYGNPEHVVSVDFPYTGGSKTVTIECNTNWRIERFYEDDYYDGISISPMSGHGNGNIKITVSQTNEERCWQYSLDYGKHSTTLYVNQEKNSYYEKHSASGLYVAITGFNDQLTKYRSSSSYKNFYSIKDSYSDLYNFCSSLKTNDGTVLYYAVENAIDILSGAEFPSDLTNVSLITFTDGLDQGSSAYNPSYGSASEYLNALNKRLKSVKVGGLPINAYTIGLKGNDVRDDAQFQQNIEKLATTPSNAMLVTNINEVNAKFQELAASLYSESASQALTLTIPKPYNNTKIRFTFDVGKNGDAAASEYYIEGTYNDNDGALTGITYKGVTSSSGSKVMAKSAGVINIAFSFNKLEFKNGFEMTTSNIRQWELIPNTGQWQINSEFNPDKSVDKTVEQKSAAVMLLLDCSSSLGNDFSSVKNAAQNFLKTLNNAYK